jgi:hypothetical protein
MGMKKLFLRPAMGWKIILSICIRIEPDIDADSARGYDRKNYTTFTAIAKLPTDFVYKLVCNHPEPNQTIAGAAIRSD